MTADRACSCRRMLWLDLGERWGRCWTADGKTPALGYMYCPSCGCRLLRTGQVTVPQHNLPETILAAGEASPDPRQMNLLDAIGRAE